MTVEKVQAFKCPQGHLETDPARAAAWHISSTIGIDFTPALRVVENHKVIAQILQDFEVSQ